MAYPLSRSLRADRVGSLRLREVCSVAASTSIEQVVRQMTQARTGCVLVLGGAGDVVGIFTERDYLTRVVAAGRDVDQPVEAVMTRSPTSVGPDASVYEAVEFMERGGYRHLPVVGEDGKPAGILSVKAVIHYLVEYFPAKVYNLPPTPSQAPPAREGA